MKRLLILLMALLGWIGTGMAQADANQMKALQQLAQVWIGDSVQERRLKAAADFKAAFKKVLEVPGALQGNYDSLIQVAQLIDPDGGFKIFTWEVFHSDNVYQHGGFLVTKDKVWELEEQVHSLDDLYFQEFSAAEWPGALYYNLRPFQFGKQEAWLLFGYNSKGFFERRKLLDVLWFDKQGTPHFGAPVFAGRDPKVKTQRSFRFILDYSAESKIKLNYDESVGKIVFDHLIPAKSPEGDDRTLMVPDGSYDAFVYSNKYDAFVREEKLPVQVMEQAPVPAPILDKRSRDILGRPGKKAKTP